MCLGESEYSHLVSVSWMSWIIYLAGWSKLFYVVASVWDPYQKYNSERVQLRAERFVNSRYSRYSSVSDMLDVLGWLPFSQRRYEARLIVFYQIINGLAKCPFECVHIEAYKYTRRNYQIWFQRLPPACDGAAQKKILHLENWSSSIQDQHPFWPSFFVSSQSCVSMLTHYSSELLLRRHQELWMTDLIMANSKKKKSQYEI